ncbi:MAG: nuclear transport factor 2 family protein [Pseudomonadota bacterium]
MTYADRLCQDYLAALEAADLDGIVALFAPHANVMSPLYGKMPVRAFYAALFRVTTASKTTLRRVFSSADGSVALQFVYEWTMSDGTVATFDVVDVFELDAAGERIEALTIIYDTAPLRAAHSALAAETPSAG